MNKKIRAIGAALLVGIWVVLTGFAWFAPAKESSDAERRPLEQMPDITLETLLNGKFMTKFEDYTLDQFPLRDTFRQIKSLFHYYVLNQGDNNGIYVADGYAAKLEYPLKQSSVDHATERFNNLYETYLKDTGSKIYMAAVPDKGYYLAEENGYMALDYEELFAQLEQAMPWATHVDITDCLSIEDYYRTDTHWRQEKILPVAQKLSQAMGVTVPQAEDFTVTQVERPFYGVYYGQAALPMEPDTMYLMKSPLLEKCRVINHESNRVGKVYDMSKMNSKDLYDLYLSGAQALLTIENPSAKTDRELIVFRDSFGSSLIPLLVQDYKTVTIVDIRYINSALVGNYVEFTGQDVLMLYSTLVLNSSFSLQ